MRYSRFVLLVILFASVPASSQDATNPQAKEPGLLFYLSGDRGFQADYAAGGRRDPNFLKDVKILPGGAKGSYLQAGNDQLLSYWAPGNIYSQRGTLSFYWRSRDPVDATEFPVFRVGYADHSSWDMVWLRIDYNGHGFDAFVTDVNLGRTRVSYTMPSFPKPSEWVHLALAWDETTGIRFYVNGHLAGEKAATGMFDAALDQFGPHSRIIGPSGVESSYNYDRGGDIDELRIYDRMLSDDNIASLARGEAPQSIPALARTVTEPTWQKEWFHNFGWNRPNDIPAPLPAAETIIRKVEINDAYDLKRWWWRGTDGIPETTWPGVYNRSTLTGRFDYFQLPDWDCYALSGKSVTFYMPNEPWNHLEIQGGAWGNVALLTPGNGSPAAIADPDQWDPSPQLARTLFERPEGQERTTHEIAQPITGQHIRFTNAKQEWPIGEFSAFYVHPGKEPTGAAVLRYTITTRAASDNPSISSLAEFIHNRFPEDERSTMIAMPGGTITNDPRAAIGHGRASASDAAKPATPLPIVHILIPSDFRELQADEGHGTSYSWENLHAGLDGIAIDLPALNLKPTHGDYVPMNIQIKDPIWPMRDLLDFSFSVKPGEPHTLWLDTRDRILAPGKSLYLTIASAGADFGPAALEGMHLRLIFKPWDDAKPEHIADRLTQVRDNYSNMVEESVNSRKLNLFNRFDADITDLLRVDPDNDLGRKYWAEMNHEQPKPPFTPPTAPAGVPQWAFLQTINLNLLNRQIDWWIDHRQISDGEFGGGLSDDSDYLNWWPGLAFMGGDQERLKHSLLRALDAMYANNMFTNGIATAQYDELHSYEDGLNTLGQALQLDFGSPKQLERAMESSRRLEWATGINSAGQRQVRSSYFGGTKMAEGGVWGWAKGRSYMIFHPAMQLVLFNGTPETRKMITEIADGFLAHRHADANGKMGMHYLVNFHTNEDKSDGTTPWFILWAAYKWTSDPKYLVPFADDPVTYLRIVNADLLDILKVRDTWGKQLLQAVGSDRRDDAGVASETNQHFKWQLTGDTANLDTLYTTQIETAVDRKFINTEGSLWIDRIYFNHGELQRARLGGVALTRNNPYPGNVISWKFDPPPASPPAPQPDLTGPSLDRAQPSSEIISPSAGVSQNVAILVPIGTPDHIKITVFNLEQHPVTGHMTGWEIDPGKWELTQGTQATETSPIAAPATSTVDFERSKDLTFTFAPGATTTVELTLKQKGVPYWSRPDLGIDPDDVKVVGSHLTVTVHSLGSVDAPAARVVLRDRNGKELASAKTPHLKAPVDLYPKTANVTLTPPAKSDWKGGSVTIESTGPVPEITLMNNRVPL